MRDLITRTLSLAPVFTLIVIADLAAQETAPAAPSPDEPVVEACSGPEFRQFDFWLGHWEVTDTAGRVVGVNTITAVAGGCGVDEYWQGARGLTGTSVNWYDPQTGKWHQVWVGPGLYLTLSGGIEDGNMVLAGSRQTPEGEVIDRITWIPLEDGRVQQVWDTSRDGGETWRVDFDGMYAKN